MSEVLLYVLIALVASLLVLVGFLSQKIKNSNNNDLLKNLETLEKNQEKLEKALKEEIARNREETNLSAKHSREEMSNSFKSFGESLFNTVSVQLKDVSTLQKDNLENFSKNISSLNQTVSERLDKMREAVADNLKRMQEDNSVKLDQMRATVDEKLHHTLEKRLGESFKLVSDRLELVHKGLGEMQSLASGVGDLKNILSNVKTRGTWGEIQLGNLLEQLLTNDQYESNVQIKKNSQERVDYAIKLPGRNQNEQEHIWLPIDAKFPQEDYQRLIDAYEKADHASAEEAHKQLESRIKLEAKSIKEKYINPPTTTDFAILFLPVEGLYAEIIRKPGLCEKLQREHRIVIAGPTTLSALLNSLQMGFRTLAIEKRSSEVWSILNAVKNEFGKFGDILEKTQKKLQEASNTIDTATRKSRTIERKLNNVQGLPSEETENLLIENN